MKIKLHEITVRELTDGYEDNADEGVVGYGGALDIRPPYQREFVYKDKQKEAVIDSLTNGYPLNVMYWADKQDGSFEVLDGQQRTIAIAQYVIGDFSFNRMYFHNLTNDEQERILDYKLMVYFCSGADSEKLQWFETINIAGEKLTPQELKNAVYSGSWVTDAKRYFSKNSCVAHEVGGSYLAGVAIRQEYLETAIKWISEDSIEDYMGRHQHDEDALPLWEYFQEVIAWVAATFTKKRKEMKGVDWGELHRKFKGQALAPAALEAEVAGLMEDEDVSNKKGIYAYVLTRDQKHLNIRAFNDKQKREAYERQGGICVMCDKHFEMEDMEGDHITPWVEGGKTDAANCQMLCKECNRRKSNK